ncbi:MAG TPA: thioredoxin [Gemmatimonadaceae bacterium]|jgi:thioredoxin 2|nr:thioredoxin [Gemmatimonadaceae bacterium]
MPTAQDTTPLAPHVTLPCPACGRWNRIAARRMTDGPKCGVCGAPLHLDHPILLTDATFDRVIAETTLPVLVDFYADWCGPCRMMAPAVDELARTSAGRALVAKLDTDASQRVSARFQIRGIPTVIVFRNGREVRRESGVMTLPALRGMIA